MFFCSPFTAGQSNQTSSLLSSPRGNALRQASAWRVSRGSLLLVVVAMAVVGTLTWLYLASGDPYTTETLVRQAEVVAQTRVYTVDCSEDYENYKRYPGGFKTTQICIKATI